MKIAELISELQEIEQECGEDTEVRLAFQPSWPLQYNIGQVVIVGGDQFEVDDDYYEEGDENYNDAPEEPIIYISEAGQVYDSPYLSGAASTALGW